jgi:hypothetical protein
MRFTIESSFQLRPKRPANLKDYFIDQMDATIAESQFVLSTSIIKSQYHDNKRKFSRGGDRRDHLYSLYLDKSISNKMADGASAGGS